MSYETYSQATAPKTSFNQQMWQTRYDLDKDVDEKHRAAPDSHDTDIAHGRINSIRRASQNPNGDNDPKKLSTIQAAIIFVTNEIGIGILSLPAALNTLGMFPGLLCIIVMGLLSLYSAYILVQYYRRYPYVLNIVDYGRSLGGPVVEAIFAVGFLINMALTCASAAITISIGLNTISEHAICTLGFTAATSVAMWMLCIPRTMKFVSYCGWPCTVSIVGAVMITMISIGINGPKIPDRPLNIKAIGNPTFTQATSSFLNVAFAFAGNQAFPTVLAEMENPSRDFPRAVTLEKCFTISMYLIVAIVCYSCAGDQITSPAIGSAPPTMAKVAYGVIFVSLLGTGLVFGHTATKYIHVTWMRHFHLFGLGHNRRPSEYVDPARLRRKSTLHIQPASRTVIWITWTIVVTAFWIVVWIIAGAIPIFDSLLNISAALLLSWFTWGIPVFLWFHLNWKDQQWRRGWKKISLALLNVFILFIVLFMNTGGMYASIANMLDIFNDPNSSVSSPFSCADNSLSI